jgi:hypothetical protein
MVVTRVQAQATSGREVDPQAAQGQHDARPGWLRKRYHPDVVAVVPTKDIPEHEGTGRPADARDTPRRATTLRRSADAGADGDHVEHTPADGEEPAPPRPGSTRPPPAK